MVLEHNFTYNCKVIPPSNEHVFVVRDHSLHWYHNFFPLQSMRLRWPNGYRRSAHLWKMTGSNPGRGGLYITDRADEIIWKRGLQNRRRSECEARGPESNFASRVSK